MIQVVYNIKSIEIFIRASVQNFHKSELCLRIQ